MSVAVVICDSDTDLYTHTSKLITLVLVSSTGILENLVNFKTAGLKLDSNQYWMGGLEPNYMI